jgi:hypothetical protein
VISRSLTRDMEPEEDPGGRGDTPFAGEDAVTMVHLLCSSNGEDFVQLAVQPVHHNSGW